VEGTDNGANTQTPLKDLELIRGDTWAVPVAYEKEKMVQT